MKKQRFSKRVKNKTSFSKWALVILLIAFISFVINYLAANEFCEVNPIVKKFIVSGDFSNASDKTNTVSIKVPAVDNYGKGVASELVVQAKPGYGRVLTDINSLSFWVDTQESIRNAKNVAENVTGIDLTKYDLVYSVIANATLIEGPSAGAALGVATVAALENKNARSDVMITGTLEEDGTIGLVGEVLTKAKVAKENNASIFLVPPGQSIEKTQTKEESCRTIIFMNYCETKWVTEETDVEKEVGIEVVEVANITAAMDYILQK